MTKMIEILSELPHRFILSKGVIGEEYNAIMGDNMAGENYIDQLAVLQTVEMIISHGGVRRDTFFCRIFCKLTRILLLNRTTR